MTGAGAPIPSYVNRQLLGAERFESLVPSFYRPVIYPDGRHAIQGGFTWVEGIRHGVTWRDLNTPPILVDAAGEALFFQPEVLA